MLMASVLAQCRAWQRKGRRGGADHGGRRLRRDGVEVELRAGRLSRR